MISSRFPSGGGQKINNSTPVEVVAADQIKIGDTVYTVKNDPTLKVAPYIFEGRSHYELV